MSSPEAVLHEILQLMPDLKEQVVQCKRFAPDVKGFTTQIKLVGDSDVGTLVDAPSPLIATDNLKLSKEFDDCVRNALQLIELPPIKTGEAFSVDFEVEL